MPLSDYNASLEAINRQLGYTSEVARDGAGRASGLGDELRSILKTVGGLSLAETHDKLNAVRSVAATGEEAAEAAAGRMIDEAAERESENDHLNRAIELTEYMQRLLNDGDFTNEQGIQISLNEIQTDLDEAQGLIGALHLRINAAREKALIVQQNFIKVGGDTWLGRTYTSLTSGSAIGKGEDLVSKAQTEMTKFQQHINR